MKDMYKVWEVGNQFYVVNRLSHRIHSGWSDLIEARKTANKLNLLQIISH